MTPPADMTIEASSSPVSTKVVVMYGEDFRSGSRKWYERYFDSVDKAVRAAQRQSWSVDQVKRTNDIIRKRVRLA